MKKFFLLCISIFLLFPTIVNATETTEKLYIDIKVREDGSIFVREIADLEGKGSSNAYNGRFRTITYKNNDNSIYNGSNLHSLKVYNIQDKNITFQSMNNLYEKFVQVNSAFIGDKSVFTKEDDGNSVNIKIYNPSNTNTSFYIEYIIDDVIIKHDDILELGWNILGKTYEENINDLEVRVHLPREDKNMRVWAHGPLNGNIKRLDDATAILKYDFLGAYNPIDIRMTFDKNLAPNVEKEVKGEALPLILKEEQEKANDANKKRDKIKYQNNLIKLSSVLWYFLFIATIIYFYFKYDKEHKSDFTMTYYREFPNTYGPEILEYLLKKNVTADGFSASILDLIARGVITVDSVNDKKKDYCLLYQKDLNKEVTKSEEIILNLLFTTIGTDNKVLLSAVKNYGKSYEKAQDFIQNYNMWENEARKNGISKNFYYKGKIFFPMIILALLGFLLVILNISFETNFLYGYLIVIIAIIGITYTSFARKKTESGLLEYKKWMAFKKFLQDFGRMDEKELPEVALWDKYLVYATVLGCAKQLEHDMKINLDKMNIDNNIDGMDVLYMENMALNMAIRSSMASTITNSVQQAVASSRSSIAASMSANGDGFGGGVSSGGGSFGGGGGGGRF